MRRFYLTTPWIREASGTDWSLQHLQPQPSSSSPSQAPRNEWHCVVLTPVTETPKFPAEPPPPPLTSAWTKQRSSLSPADVALTRGTGGSCRGAVSRFQPTHGKSLSTQALSYRCKGMKEKKHSVKRSAESSEQNTKCHCPTR